MDRKATHGLEISKLRVNADEEIELAKMIQRGVWLHELKIEEETKRGRSINKNEWAELAHFDHPKQLRRDIAMYRRAKQLLVSANMGLVHAVVRKKYPSVRQNSGITYEELIQEGSLGLIRAAELYQYQSRNIRFSTYATIWIKGSLSHSHILDGTIRLPSREKMKWSKILKAQRDILNETGGYCEETIVGDGNHTGNNKNMDQLSSQSDAAASVKSMGVSVVEISKRLGMKTEDVIKIKQKMNSAKKVLSLEYEYNAQSRGGSNVGRSSGKSLIMDMDKNLHAETDLAHLTQMKADVISSLVRNLSPREARLMRLRYGLTTDGRTRTIQECADAMGVSQQRASQLAKRCLEKLRDAAEADGLEEYLLTVA